MLRRIWATTFAICFYLITLSGAYAFTSRTHQDLVRDAFRFVRQNPRSFSGIGYWLERANAKRFEDLIVKSDVDADSQADIWLQAALHSPFPAAGKGDFINYFVTFMHHVNVTVPGKFWTYDGYAYGNTSGAGNDSYLSLPTLVVRGEVSPALGEPHRDHSSPYLVRLGPYDEGFLGTVQQWKAMFFGGSAGNAVFPPAYVPATMAYRKLLESTRATTNISYNWSETFPVVTGVINTEDVVQNYWTAEISGLPQNLQLLGLVLHLTQDMGVPHHTQGVAAYCHPEFEDHVEQMSAHESLYDPATVKKLISYWPFLFRSRKISLAERMIEMAHISSRWWWGEHEDQSDMIEMKLPNGNVYSAKTCKELLDNSEVKYLEKFHYNLSVAMTAVVLDIFAKDYEREQSSSPWNLIEFLSSYSTKL